MTPRDRGRGLVEPDRTSGMKGHHAVRVFTLNGGGESDLPPGWKPFAVLPDEHPYFLRVLCRKWYRLDTRPSGSFLERVIEEGLAARARRGG